MRTRNYDELLLDLYGCPGDQGRWPSVLDKVCAATGARSAVVQRLVRGHDHAWARWMARDSRSEADAAEHERYMGDDVNPRMRIASHPPLAAGKGVIRDRDLFDPQDPAFAELRERLAALRLGSFMGVTMDLADGGLLVLALHRGLRDHREFHRAEESFARQLLPHLNQAVTLTEQHSAFRSRNDDFAQLLDVLRVGCVLCGPDGLVHWANATAHGIFAQHDRLWLRQDRLTCSNVQETTTLHTVINQATARAQTARGVRTTSSLGEPRGAPSDRARARNAAGWGDGAACFAIGQGGGGGALHVMLVPASAAHGAGACTHQREEGRALMLLTDPHSITSLSAKRTSRLFGLSPAEARVAAALCEGLSVSEYAAAHGITSGTARFQLKQALAKTGSERQSDLVRKIFSSVLAHAHVKPA
jgi:DNA-binding CsgD family transcriptional regulator